MYCYWSPSEENQTQPLVVAGRGEYIYAARSLISSPPDLLVSYYRHSPVYSSYIGQHLSYHLDHLFSVEYTLDVGMVEGVNL